MRARLPLRLPALLLLALACVVTPARAASRIGDLTLHEGDVPRRLVGYGLVVGLDGTGDRSFGSGSSGTPTVRSVVNLLRRFEVDVPTEQLRLRNVATVVVTAEVSPYLRAGGRFEVQVSALGDATSLRGGVLWMTPLIRDPGAPPEATAQGPVYVAPEDRERTFYGGRHANGGRIIEGGIIESNEGAPPPGPKLVLRRPDFTTATRIAAAVNAAFGVARARVEDPGSVVLDPHSQNADSLASFFAAVDTLSVEAPGPARVVIDGHDGTVVAGGAIRVGAATVSHHGFTLEVSAGTAAAGGTGMVHLGTTATVEEVAAGLHAAGARAEEIAAIFEALVAAGALAAPVVIR